MTTNHNPPPIVPPSEADRAAAEAWCMDWVVSGEMTVAVPSLAQLLATTRAAERERCARAAEQVTPRHTECGNRIAAAIRRDPPDGRARERETNRG